MLLILNFRFGLWTQKSWRWPGEGFCINSVFDRTSTVERPKMHAHVGARSNMLSSGRILLFPLYNMIRSMNALIPIWWVTINKCLRIRKHTTHRGKKKNSSLWFLIGLSRWKRQMECWFCGCTPNSAAQHSTMLRDGVWIWIFCFIWFLLEKIN